MIQAVACDHEPRIQLAASPPIAPAACLEAHARSPTARGSNSFVLPTHQVNALIMGAGGYSTADFMRAGSIMTIVFLVVMLAVVNLVM